MEVKSMEEAKACWSVATNWIVADGALDASIAFDTTTEDAPAVAPGGALLVPPPSQDSLSCEITVSFKEKHDIHRVYVRSTARIYEIYYGTDDQNHSKDYICTVRCGPAEKEGAPCVTEGATTESQECNEGTMKIPDQPVRSDSNISDEDGWIQVKLPVSPKQDDPANSVGSISSNFQINYEATAEISDASPCVSLTLRLLSLQSMTGVHVEEIYIYADPAANEDPPVSMEGNMGGSLLAMLVPGLLQMRNSGSSRIENKSLSDESMVLNNQHGVGKEFDNVTDSAPLPEPVNDAINVADRRVEKVLDELVSRVGRIESFCSRLEENMMKPLGRIEMRLQQLEQKLDAFAASAQPSEPFPCSRVAAQEFPFPESDSENGDDVAVPESQLFPGLIVTAPEFENDDADSVAESEGSTDLQAKAPEFVNEEDEGTVSYDALDSPVKGRSGLSVDDALASALEAFLSSSSLKSFDPSLIDAPAPDNLSDESDVEIRVCEEELTDPCDSPLLADDGACTGMVAVAPDFPIEGIQFIVSEDESASPIPTCGGPASPLAEFLSSKKAKASNFSRALLPDSSLELSSADKNESVSLSSFGVPFEEDDDDDSKVDLRLILCSGVRKLKTSEEGLLEADPLWRSGLRGNDLNHSWCGGSDTADVAAPGGPTLNLQRALAADSEDLILDLNLAPETNWRGGRVPPEVLQGEMSVGLIGSGWKCFPTPSMGVDRNLMTGVQLLPGVDDLIWLVEPSCLGGGGMQEGPGSSKQLPFPSLI